MEIAVRGDREESTRTKEKVKQRKSSLEKRNNCNMVLVHDVTHGLTPSITGTVLPRRFYFPSF